MGDRVGSFHPFGQQHGVVDVQANEAAVEAAVLVVDAGAQMGDLLAGRLDQVLDALEYPGAHRTVGDREDPLATHVARQRG